jgi:phosphatidate cytidylyltransferase
MTLGAFSVEAAIVIAGTVGVLAVAYHGMPGFYVYLVAATTVIGVFVSALRLGDRLPEAASRIGHSIAAFGYVSLLFAGLVLLVRVPNPQMVGPHQAAWLLFPMFVIWAGDTGAYFAGHRFGRHKLAPRISPGKTIEGAVGGLIASMAGGFLAWAVLPFPDALTPLHVVIFALPGAVLGQAGDLCESLIKRATGHKDSSRLIYGHGGVLDRVDALIFAAPWFAAAKLLLQLP